MEVVIKLDQDDLGCLNDILCEIEDREYTEEECRFAWTRLPRHIQAEAMQWGTSDSVFRDNAFVYLRDHRG